MEQIDQAQPTVDAGESQPSSEVLAAMGLDDQAPEPTTQEEKVALENDTSTKTDPEQETEAKPEDSEEETTSEQDEEEVEETKEDEKESKTFLIGGTEYDNIEAAAVAINRINGDNTRLSGDVKRLNQEVVQKDEDIATLKAKIKEWQDYYDGDETGESPKDKVNVTEEVQKALKAERDKKAAAEQAEAEQQRQAQYSQELETIQKEPDYAKVLPKMQSLAAELGDAVIKIPPKRLFAMARAELNSEDVKGVLDTADELAKDKVTREENRKKATKVIGGNARKSPSIQKEPDDISPEVAALI